MGVHELAGKPAPESLRIDVPVLISAYYTLHPDPLHPAHRIAFGTSGHRGSSCHHQFNEDHIACITQAICEYRRSQGIEGPLFLGKDTHALSEPSFRTAVEVLAANGVSVYVQEGFGYTPTPVVSHAVLCWNRSRNQPSGKADGIVITPSHNPPEDGGFKYNPPHGGPAETPVTRWIENRANDMLGDSNAFVRRISWEKALASGFVRPYDYVLGYVADLEHVIDMAAIRKAGLRLGVDPMGGAAVRYWDVIADRYGLDIRVVNPAVDPTFLFMTVDKDGRIRMDCSSPYAMQRLIGMKAEVDLAFGNDPDVDRHGIVTPDAGLMAPNPFLAVCIDYLFRNRPLWKASTAVGKTLVSSAMIDRVAADLGRTVVEVPVGFKWFVDGLLSGAFGFCGEESAGATLLRRNGDVWTTDKDGIVLDLLAAEILAVTGKTPSLHYETLRQRLGSPVYERIDEKASPEQKAALLSLTPDAVSARELAGEPILAKLTRAPGNDQPIGGLKVVTENGWFAARPSGTENVYKIYAESFRGKDHLTVLQQEARAMVAGVFAAAGCGGE
ncbi:MAG: phosphoglucomutase (alpha-D-glucose-1,6-bisphosphate-dependent) [Thermodesulfobacteriota bacterium]